MKRFGSIFNTAYFLCFISVMFSCQSFLDVDPPKDQLSSELVFQDDETVNAAIVGIYNTLMERPSSFINHKISKVAGLTSDEFITHSSMLVEQELFTNNLSPNNIETEEIWNSGYTLINYANGIIEGLKKDINVSVSVSNQAIGEAKFIRAFAHFYLVNLFGDIPYVTSTDYRINNSILRISKNEVYDAIIRDLEDAKNLLLEDYPSDGRIRPNKWTASALLARVYLYTNRWALAETESSEIINTSVYNLPSDLNSVFLADSEEAIWQLQPVIAGRNTNEGYNFVLTTKPTSIALSNSLISTFEASDNRMTNWVGSISIDGETYYFPNKYKIKTGVVVQEYLTVFRLAEQYLIRAEARAQLADLEGSITDVDVIRARANLPLIQNISPDIGKDELLLVIEQERKVEFFSEMGHRWFDLKRTGRAEALLDVVKSPNWTETDLLYPIPLKQIEANPKFGQNDGY